MSEEKVMCTVCRTVVVKQRFCPECGAPLKDAKVVSENEIKKEEHKKEDTRTLLVSSVTSTVSLPGFENKQEIVLYQNGTSFELHTYEVKGKVSEHKAYRVDDSFKDDVFAVIEKTQLESYRNKNGDGIVMGGQICSCSFMNKNNEEVTISLNNLPKDKFVLLNEVSACLYRGVKAINEIK